MIRRPFRFGSKSPTRKGVTLKYRGFSEAYGDFTREIDLEELAINPDELFAGVRDDIHGREVNL